jgi:methylthioribose-1-phosphate isomerase
MKPLSITWKDGSLSILDQTLLPGSVVERQLDTVESVWDAIKTLKVRGAPAIGVCAAYGVVVGVHRRNPRSTQDVVQAVHDSADYLATSRPTAVNLFWALDRMRRVAHEANGASASDLIAALEAEAVTIHEEDRALCMAIGRHGSSLIGEGCGVLTHCNAGALATAEHGTALSIMYAAQAEGRRFRVYADETRPLLQGARLTAWELTQAGIDTTLICDNMAAQVMREGKIDLVVVGADRIAANGDTANKIGTYGVALLAKAHGIPFYVAAPYSTFDLSLATGEQIPIEERDSSEITHPFGAIVAPAEVKVYNPAFDVTPAALIHGFITEAGIVHPPFSAVSTTSGE